MVFTETYSIGGSEKFVLDLVTALDPDRYECMLAGNVHPELDAWLSARAKRPIERHEIPIRSVHTPWVSQFRHTLAGRRGARDQRREAPASDRHRLPPLKAAVTYGQMVANYVALRSLFERLQPDVLHVNNGGYPAARGCQIAPVAAKAAGVGQVISFVHAYPMTPGPYPRLEKALDRRVDRSTDSWVTAAYGATDRLAAARDIPAAKIETVHLGQALLAEIDPADRAAGLRAMGLAPDVTTIFQVGSLEPNKGQVHAIEALARVRADGHQCHLLLAGEGPDSAGLEELARRRGLAEHVTLLGYRHDIEQLLTCCDVMLSASTVTELLPYALKEAMARGLPTVATDVGSTRELVVDGVTGLLVPPGDPGAIAVAVGSLAGDPAKRMQLGRAGRKRIAAEFSMAGMIDRLQTIYDGQARR